jgi:hypothetical protein
MVRILYHSQVFRDFTNCCSKNYILETLTNCETMHTKRRKILVHYFITALFFLGSGLVHLRKFFSQKNALKAEFLL